MKKLLLSTFLLCGFLVQGNLNAQSIGFNSSYAIISTNGGTSSTYYCMVSNTSCGGNPALNGTNLGTFTQGTTDLMLTGVQNNIYKCSGGNVTGTALFYRIYPSGSPSGSYSQLGTGYESGNNNGCSGADQRWSTYNQTINLLSGLTPGTYTMEIYDEAYGSPSNAYLSNLGNNYKVTFTVVGPTPITFGDITAVTTNAGIAINWQVLTQMNVGGYEIQRSADGKGFITIGRADASTASNYTFVDANAPGGTNLYRIKEVDLDGKTTYSKIVSQKGTAGHLFLSPNPVGATLFLNRDNAAAAVTVGVYDLQGKLIKKFDNVYRSVNLGPFSPGAYLVKITDAENNLLLQDKIIKQ